MSTRLKYLVILLTLFSWPYNLFLANTNANFLTYTIPSLLLYLSYYLLKNNYKYSLIPILFIPIFEPKLAIVPILFVVLQHFFSKGSTITRPALIASLVIFITLSSQFVSQSIFVKDYEARQEVLREINLYPNPLIARVFQNKARIHFDKFADNLFSLTDPNNYFFSFHPREIVIENQNLDKYPFLAIMFFLVGLYYLKKSTHYKFIISLTLSGVIALSFLSNFDRNDFILWLPISLIIINGVDIISVKPNKYKNIFSVIYIFFTITQFIRNYLSF